MISGARVVTVQIKTHLAVKISFVTVVVLLIALALPRLTFAKPIWLQCTGKRSVTSGGTESRENDFVRIFVFDASLNEMSIYSEGIINQIENPKITPESITWDIQNTVWDYPISSGQSNHGTSHIRLDRRTLAYTFSSNGVYPDGKAYDIYGTAGCHQFAPLPIAKPAI